MTDQKQHRFVKDDFLTASAAAKKFGTSTEIARSIFRTLYLKRAIVTVNAIDAAGKPRGTHKMGAVLENRKKKDTYRLHPLAYEMFQAELEKLGKQK